MIRGDFQASVWLDIQRLHQSHYQQLMPTLEAAGQLSVGERDRRFAPAIRSAFDIATMTRLATGPAWSGFSGAQQAAVREAFAGFLVAEYAHEVSDYSGESFVVDPQTSPESRGGGEVGSWRQFFANARFCAFEGGFEAVAAYRL